MGRERERRRTYENEKTGELRMSWKQVERDKRMAKETGRRETKLRETKGKIERNENESKVNKRKRHKSKGNSRKTIQNKFKDSESSEVKKLVELCSIERS